MQSKHHSPRCALSRACSPRWTHSSPRFFPSSTWLCRFPKSAPSPFQQAARTALKEPPPTHSTAAVSQPAAAGEESRRTGLALLLLPPDAPGTFSALPAAAQALFKEDLLLPWHVCSNKAEVTAAPDKSRWCQQSSCADGSGVSSEGSPPALQLCLLPAFLQ